MNRLHAYIGGYIGTLLERVDARVEIARDSTKEEFTIRSVTAGRSIAHQFEVEQVAFLDNEDMAHAQARDLAVEHARHLMGSNRPPG